MQIREKDIQVLSKLGLTPKEAMIFLTLTKIGKEKIETISTVASTDRSDTYHLIKKLQSIGLITVILGKPSFYEPIPLKEAISLLLRRKKEEQKILEKQAKELAERDTETIEEPTGFQFKLTTKRKESLQQQVIDACRVVEQCFDLIINERQFYDSFLNLKHYQTVCVKRGIRYRVIIDKKTLYHNTKEIQPFIQYPNFQLRYVSAQLPALIGIMDRKNAYILLTSPEAMGKASSQLVTNHPSCIEMFLNHFETVWSQSVVYKGEEG